MSQSDYIKELAKYSLENDQEQLKETLRSLIDYSIKTKKTNFALQLQSILEDAIRKQNIGGMNVVGSPRYFQAADERDIQELILEKLTSDYKISDLICSKKVANDLNYFLQEQKSFSMLVDLELPVANKIILYGPSGCGKTLTSYVLAGELKKMMYVVNLGAIVSSKLGETSKNLAKLFKKAASEDCIIFLDEFDSLGKIRDYDQDHGEMKRVVNTLLQLFDFLPKGTIVIAATNQIKMIDDALIRRFDLSLQLGLPNKTEIKKLVENTLSKKNIKFDDKQRADLLIKRCVGLSYYIIQKTLLTALKRSILDLNLDILPNELVIKTSIWEALIDEEIGSKI
jgi:AAA+ superfamily predicted ATPase